MSEPLTRLIEYCHAVPGETARFVKDEMFLRELIATMTDRRNTVTALPESLRTLTGPPGRR